MTIIYKWRQKCDNGENITNEYVQFMNAVNDIDYSDKVAIHCRAGLGRTGILICIWLIIKLNFKPAEAIAYIRIMRPGSIMGSQGFFLESIEYFKRFI